MSSTNTRSSRILLVMRISEMCRIDSCVCPPGWAGPRLQKSPIGLRELITEVFVLAGVEPDRGDNARSSKSRSGDQRFLRAVRSAQPRNHPQKNIAELW